MGVGLAGRPGVALERIQGLLSRHVIMALSWVVALAGEPSDPQIAPDSCPDCQGPPALEPGSLPTAVCFFVPSVPLAGKPTFPLTLLPQPYLSLLLHRDPGTGLPLFSSLGWLCTLLNPCGCRIYVCPSPCLAWPPPFPWQEKAFGSFSPTDVGAMGAMRKVS